MKLLITGATGSLGGYLVRYFARKGYTVIASGRMPEAPAGLSDFASYHVADLLGEVSFPEVDAVIHTAALSDDKATYRELYTPNVEGTRKVIAATAGCKTFIHVSSSSVYLPAPEPLTEDRAGKQDNKLLSPYGASKLKAEEVVRAENLAPSCYILRPRALYGPGDKMILPRLLKLEKNGTLSCPGGLDVQVSMTHYENFADAIERCLQVAAPGLHTYNIADAPVYRLIDVMRTVGLELFGAPLQEKVIPVAVLKLLATFRIGGITPLLVRSLTRDMVLDTSRFNSDLGFSPKLEFYSSFPAVRDWVNSIGGVEVIRSGERELAWK